MPSPALYHSMPFSRSSCEASASARPLLCCVASCVHYRRTPPRSVPLVPFPRPPSSELCRRWARCCRLRHVPRADLDASTWPHVCALHFSSDQLEVGACSQSAAAGGQQLAGVRPGVMPSRHLVSRPGAHSWCSEGSSSVTAAFLNDSGGGDCGWSADSRQTRGAGGHTVPRGVGRSTRGRSSIYSRAISRLVAGQCIADDKRGGETARTAATFEPHVRASLVQQALADYDRRRGSTGGDASVCSTTPAAAAAAAAGQRAKRGRKLSAGAVSCSMQPAVHDLPSSEQCVLDDVGESLWAHIDDELACVDAPAVAAVEEAAPSAAAAETELNINLIVESQLSPPPELDDVTRQFDGDFTASSYVVDDGNCADSSDATQDTGTLSTGRRRASSSPSPVSLAVKRRARGGDWTISATPSLLCEDAQHQHAATEPDEGFQLRMPHWMPDRFRELLLWRRHLRQLTRRLDAEPVVMPPRSNRDRVTPSAPAAEQTGRPLLVLRDDVLDEADEGADHADGEQVRAEEGGDGGRSVYRSLQPEMSDPLVNPSTLVNALSLLHHVRVENMQLRANLLTANLQLRRTTSQLHAVTTATAPTCCDMPVARMNGVGAGGDWPQERVKLAAELLQMSCADVYNFVRDRLAVRLPSVQELAHSTRNLKSHSVFTSDSVSLPLRPCSITTSSANNINTTAPPTSGLDTLKDVQLDARRMTSLVDEQAMCDVSRDVTPPQLGDAPLWEYFSDYVDGCAILPGPASVPACGDSRAVRGASGGSVRTALDSSLVCQLPDDTLDWSAQSPLAVPLRTQLLPSGETDKTGHAKLLHDQNSLKSRRGRVGGAKRSRVGTAREESRWLTLDAPASSLAALQEVVDSGTVI